MRRGGDARGNTRDRARRARWLVDTYGNGTFVLCAFPGCPNVLTVDTVTADRYPIPGCHGGRYVHGNIRPACADCNSRHGGSLRARKDPPCQPAKSTFSST